MNWQPSKEDAPGPVSPGLGVAEPEVISRPVADIGDPEGDWLCAFCLRRVANERDRFKHGGKDEFIFANPAGIRFEIITFRQTRGCKQSGTPTLEHTWFAGHAWSYCGCAGCGQHLGWFYQGPSEFVGLIKPRIVRALVVRN